jgi:hypothetical protein
LSGGYHARPKGRRVMSWLPYIAGLLALSAIVLLVVGSLLKD